MEHISKFTQNWFERKGLVPPDQRMDEYLENHGHDHDAENAEAREAMDMRDHFDEHPYGS